MAIEFARQDDPITGKIYFIMRDTRTHLSLSRDLDPHNERDHADMARALETWRAADFIEGMDGYEAGMFKRLEAVTIIFPIAQFALIDYVPALVGFGDLT